MIDNTGGSSNKVVVVHDKVCCLLELEQTRYVDNIAGKHCTAPSAKEFMHGFNLRSKVNSFASVGDHNRGLNSVAATLEERVCYVGQDRGGD